MRYLKTSKTLDITFDYDTETDINDLPLSLKIINIVDHKRYNIVKTINLDKYRQ